MRVAKVGLVESLEVEWEEWRETVDCKRKSEDSERTLAWRKKDGTWEEGKDCEVYSGGV